MKFCTFEFDRNLVRTLTENDQVWFVGRDVASALGYKDTRKAVNQHCLSSMYLEIQTSNGVKKARVISEADLYRLIVRSSLPSASRFERWVFETVLPTIGLHGAYMTPETLALVEGNTSKMSELIKSLKEANSKLEILQSEIDQNQHKVLFYDTIANVNDTISVGCLAGVLNANGYTTGQNRLFADLRRLKHVIKRPGSRYNEPTQQATDGGFLKTVQYLIEPDSGKVRLGKSTRVTRKGQEYYLDLFLGTTLNI